ncbi:hypothetical protein AMTRI_Chr05g60770 [Amborella trichopoda]
MVLCTKSFLLYYDEEGEDGLFSNDLHGIRSSISFAMNKDAWEVLDLKHFFL